MLFLHSGGVTDLPKKGSSNEWINILSDSRSHSHSSQASPNIMIVIRFWRLAIFLISRQDPHVQVSATSSSLLFSMQGRETILV